MAASCIRRKVRTELEVAGPFVSTFGGLAELTVKMAVAMGAGWR